VIFLPGYVHFYESTPKWYMTEISQLVAWSTIISKSQKTTDRKQMLRVQIHNNLTLTLTLLLKSISDELTIRLVD